MFREFLLSLDDVGEVPKDFIGREEEIDKIRVFVGNGSSPSQVVVLYGPPLVGKSTLARRLLNEFSSLYPDGHFVVDMKGAASHYLQVYL